MTISGLETLLADPRMLQGRNVGIITNQTGFTDDLRASTADALAAVRGCTVRALFGPEHGLNGAVQDAIYVGDAQGDGIPVYSLYGKKLKPTPEMLAGLDLLVFDVQDIGTRYYTYLNTLSYVMEAAAEAGIEVLVLDRPNPINGLDVEGPLLSAETASFVGRYPIPVRHGLTVGEFARYVADRHVPECKVSVQRMHGWRRDMYFEDTGLPWMAASPNLPTVDCAVIYPGMCLIEGTNLSEARGTTHPFEWFGAPWVDANVLVRRLNGLELPGCAFRPLNFEPRMSKHNGKVCAGAQIHVFNRTNFRPFVTGLHVIAALQEQKGFAFLPSSWEASEPHFDLLAGDPAIRRALSERVPVREIAAAWSATATDWKQERRAWLLY